MSAAHTPGPWQVRGAAIEAPVDPENSRTYIAPICTVDEDWRDWKHNARLIAAAPLLAAELKWARGELESQANRGYGTHHVLKRLDAALRAAGVQS